MKKMAVIGVFCALIVYIFAYIEVANTPVHVLLSEEQVKKAYYKEKESALFNFVQKHMLGGNGEIYTNIKPSGEGMYTLSESLGLLMNYCVIRNNKDLYDKTLTYLKDRFIVDNRYVKWRAGTQKADSNSAIDDFRIIGALLDGYEKWGDEDYLNMAGFIQEGIYEKQVVNGNLYELYDWKSDASKKSIPLCYYDFYNMYRVSIFNKDWIYVADRGVKLVKGGKVKSGSPLFSKYCDYETYSYLLDEEFKEKKGICTTYSIYTALHLLQYNEDTEDFTRWLKDEMEKGKLYAWYEPYSLKPAGSMESTAVYALSAVYAKKAGEDELYKEFIGRMLQFMVTDRKSKYYGGFGNESTGEFYSFDNLTALWALSLMDK